MKTRFDENDMMIGNGDWHVSYKIEEFPGLPIKIQIQESYTTETVYVKYIHTETHEIATVRFSTHICNGIKFGMYIDGCLSNVREEILYRLGFMDKIFVPNFHNHITYQDVAKKKLAQYEDCGMSYYDIIALGEGTDISDLKGKLLKGTNKVITSSVVKRVQEGGHYEYKTK